MPRYCFPLMILAVVLSVYQAYRGFMFQWIHQWRYYDERQRGIGTSPDHIKFPDNHWTKFDAIVLCCISDAIFYFLCTASGFISLHFLSRISRQVADWMSVASGTALLLVFLAVWGIFGITGQLPHLIQMGKAPLMK